MNIHGIDWSYPEYRGTGLTDFHPMTEDEANMIPWRMAKAEGGSIKYPTNVRHMTYSFPATNLSDRLPDATLVQVMNCPMHSFMMGELPRLGQASAIRLLEGKQEIFRMIKSFTPQG